MDNGGLDDCAEHDAVGGRSMIHLGDITQICGDGQSVRRYRRVYADTGTTQRSWGVLVSEKD